VATVVFPLSLGGAVLSLLLIKVACLLGNDKFSLMGLSVIGAVGHNLGQVAVLMLIPGLFPQWTVTYLLLPALILLAIPAGLATGWIAGQILPVIKREWET
jgi:heptaprenyl diphosphate synthase